MASSDIVVSPVDGKADLKAFIGEVRPKIAMHLQHAQDLQKSLQK